MGTVLERSQQFGYTIKPVYGSGGSWTGPIEYQTERQKLMKYHGSLVALLKKVREAYP